MLIHEDLDYLKNLLKKEKNVKVKNRIHFLYLKKLNPDYLQKDLCKILGVKRNCLRIWRSIYEDNGISAFLKIDKPSGRKSKLDEEKLSKLKEKVFKPEGFTSIDSIRKWISLELGVDLNYKQTQHLTCKKLKVKPSLSKNVIRKYKSVKSKSKNEDKVCLQ